ncbi:hypothetical protein N8500_02785 [Candidatus Puniceispirillum sp.]|nr:hypothetical protein [Candidatus Puniceispirillum sp.]
MNEHLIDIVNQLAAQITEDASRDRRRTSEAQAHFLNGIEHLIIQLWKGTEIHEGYEGGVNKRSGWYSESSSYRDPNFTFKQTMAAYDGLIKLGMIRQTQQGYFNRETLEGSITRFVANDELLSILSEIKEDPFKAILPDLSSQFIVLQDKVDGQKKQIDYLNTPHVNGMRDNLLVINKCLKAHYPDIRIKDEEWLPVQKRIMADPDKRPIDLTRRKLVRIFSEGRFDKGGRFYRGWWENVPREYRKYITIDGKRTNEYDYSQLNPHMVYILRSKELGSEDAYGRVFDGEHRDLVKEAFNAMIQAKTPLLKEPKDIDLSEVDFDWPFLRQAILDSHKPIQDMFFNGHGNYLHYIDSVMAEDIMLKFVKTDFVPVLPVHDSFIIHHGHGELSELEEDMRRAFYGHFKKDIKVKEEIGLMLPSSFDGKDWGELSFEEQVHGPPEYSQWENRNS